MLRVTFRDMAKLNAVGIVVTDLERAVKFYRLLGVPIADSAVSSEHGHVDATLDGGMRLMMDTEDEMRKFDPSWKRAGGSPAAKSFDSTRRGGWAYGESRRARAVCFSFCESPIGR